MYVIELLTEIIPFDYIYDPKNNIHYRVTNLEGNRLITLQPLIFNGTGELFKVHKESLLGLLLLPIPRG